MITTNDTEGKVDVYNSGDKNRTMNGAIKFELDCGGTCWKFGLGEGQLWTLLFLTTTYHRLTLLCALMAPNKRQVGEL